MTASALSGGESSPATAATICSRQSAAAISARARMFGGRRGVGFADFEHVFEAMRELGDAADAQDVGRALERVRGALGVRSSSACAGVGDPALQRLRDFRRLRRRVVHEGVDAARRPRHSRCRASGRRRRALRARPVRSRRARRRWSSPRAARRAAPSSASSSSGSGTQPPPKCASSALIGPDALASRRCASSSGAHSVKNGRTSTRASASSSSRWSRLSSTQAQMRLHALEAHVAGGFRKPRHGRYIGIVGARRRPGSIARVIGMRELGSDPLELVGECCEEILSSHLAYYPPCAVPLRPRGWWWAA